MEDHHDDCSKGPSSFHDRAENVLLCYPCNFDTDEEFSDQDHNECMRLQFGGHPHAYPVDRAK
eukprot:11174509-Lingulodinium_polyedra.AAC.1